MGLIDKCSRMKILFLSSELTPYYMPIYKVLASKGCEVHVIYWDKKRSLYNDNPPLLENVVFYKISQYNNSDILYEKFLSISPQIIVVAGWIYKLYCFTAARYRKTYNIPVIAGSDTQWRGGKQWVNVLLSPFRHKRWFSHILIAGIWQYEYARRLGFKQHQILQHCYSGDINTFFNVDIRAKEINYPHTLLFIGRFAEVKGLSFLLEAWKLIPDRKDWKLTLIGKGPLRDTLEGYPDVVIKEFMSQDLLVKEMQNAGAFILPSVFEPWALVLHEAAAGGLPILASNCCGAVPYFVLENYNGHLFIPGDVSSISNAIQHLIDTPKEELIRMSYRSRELSKRITPELVANTLLSVI